MDKLLNIYNIKIGKKTKKQKQSKKIIYYSDDINAIDKKTINEYKISLLPDRFNDDEIIYFITSDLKNDFDHMIINFDKYIKYDSIVLLADLGLWYGRRKAQKEYKTLKNLFDDSKIFYDTTTIYANSKTQTINIKTIHHDGVNYYKVYFKKAGKLYAVSKKIFDHAAYKYLFDEGLKL